MIHENRNYWAGLVGGTIGKALLKAGHDVTFSSRDPHGEQATQLKTETGAAVELPGDMLAFSQVIAIAMSPDTALQFAKAHADLLRDKVIIDINNRFGPAPSGQSFASDLAAASGVNVVKAFNIIGAEHYLNPDFDGQAATMFIAGDAADAKRITGELAMTIGFEVIEAGGLDAVRHFENLAAFWVHVVQSGEGRAVAFKLLRRQTT